MHADCREWLCNRTLRRNPETPQTILQGTDKNTRVNPHWRNRYTCKRRAVDSKGGKWSIDSPLISSHWEGKIRWRVTLSQFISDVTIQYYPAIFIVHKAAAELRKRGGQKSLEEEERRESEGRGRKVWRAALIAYFMIEQASGEVLSKRALPASQLHRRWDEQEK